MHPTTPRRWLMIGACLCALAVALAASARGRFATGADESTEVLFGSHHCGVSYSEPEGFGWLSFDATGDIVPRYTAVYQSRFPRAESLEACEGLTASIRRLAREHGCTLGGIETSEDETGASSSHQFVCHGRRSELIALLAALAAHQLTATP